MAIIHENANKISYLNVSGLTNIPNGAEFSLSTHMRNFSSHQPERRKNKILGFRYNSRQNSTCRTFTSSPSPTLFQLVPCVLVQSYVRLYLPDPYCSELSECNKKCELKPRL